MIRLIIALSCVAASAAAQSVAITNVRLHSMTGAPVENATILVEDGKIKALGRDVSVPDGVRTYDGRGQSVFPGFIDGWSTMGLTEVNSVSGSVDTREMGDWNAHLRAASAVNPFSAHIPVARVNGVVTSLVVPSGGRISGAAAAIDLNGRTVVQMLAPEQPLLRVLNLPSPPRPDYSEKEAKDYWKKAEKSWKPLEDYLEQVKRAAELLEAGVDDIGRDLDGQERLALLAAAEHHRKGGRWLVRADRREHILAALRFAEKHDLELVIGGLRDAWTVVDELKKAGHRYLVGSIFSRPEEDDPFDAAYANAAVLHRAGVPFGFMTGSASNARNLPYVAAMAVSHGLPRDAALRALTVGAATAIGLQRTHGTLQPGRAANLVLYAGDPLDVRVSPRAVFIRGRPVSLESRHTRLAEPFLERR